MSAHGGDGRILRDYMQPDRASQPSCIIFPLNIEHFEIKSRVVQLLQKFHGMDSESTYIRLRKFEEVCATINLQNIITT